MGSMGLLKILQRLLVDDRPKAKRPGMIRLSDFGSSIL
jgi:hypothetical protein